MNTPRTLLLATGLCVWAATAAGQSAPVYKWVDSGGVTHYSSQPPEGVDFEVTGIRAKRTNSSALQARVDAQADQRDARNLRREQAAEQADEEKSQREEVAAERSANCEKARERQELVDASPRLYRPLPNGDREYLSDEELDQARAEARSQVREWCD